MLRRAKGQDADLVKEMAHAISLEPYKGALKNGPHYPAAKIRRLIRQAEALRKTYNPKPN